MHVLLITQEPPFNADQVATGNALRTLQLKSALESAGHTTHQAWLDAEGSGGGHAFSSPDQLRGLIQSEAPGAILVSYWELLAMLPYRLEPPVILDFVWRPAPWNRFSNNPTAWPWSCTACAPICLVAICCWWVMQSRKNC